MKIENVALGGHKTRGGYSPAKKIDLGEADGQGVGAVIERKDMTEIHKKISREYFELIASGQKTFEYRVNDFECNPGDVLVLEEYEYENGVGDVVNRHPTGRVIRKKVGHVAKTTSFDWLDRPDVKKAFEENGAQIISLLDE